MTHEELKLIETVWENAPVLETLREGPSRQVDLPDRIDRSRRTIMRVLAEFEELGFVEQEGECWKLTVSGRSALDIYHNQKKTWGTLFSSAELLSLLPHDTPIGCDMMDGMDVVTGLEAAPHAAFAPVEEAVKEADYVQGFSPIVVERYVSLMYDQIVKHPTRVELVLPKEVIYATIDQYAAEWKDSLASRDSVIWRMKEGPDFGLIITDQSEVYVGIYQDGILAGTLRNDTEKAVAWAQRVFEDRLSDGIRVLPPTNT